jgi:hypothetical protein
MSFSQPNPQMYTAEQPGDGSAPMNPGVGGAPGMGDGSVQFAGGSMPASAGGLPGSPGGSDSKTTLWYVLLRPIL